MAGPLDGLKVLEIAEAVAGPYAAMALGDAGADVTKVETGEGDRTRDWGSHTRGDHGAVYVSLNRNKRSLAINIRSKESRPVLDKLVQEADVVVIDAGYHEVMGLRWQDVREANPKAVYFVVSEYGPHGPWANRPPYGELAAQLASEATMSLGVIGEPPVRMATDIGGMYAAIYGVQSITAALLARERTGEGQRIDVSLFGSLLALRGTLWVALSNPDFWWGFHLDSYVKPPELGYTCLDGRIFFSLARMTEEGRDQLYQELEMDWVRNEARYDMFKEDRGGLGTRHGYLLTDIWDRGFAKWQMEKVIEAIRRLGGWAFPKNDYKMLREMDQVKVVGMVDKIVQEPFGEMETLTP
ncbi:MAG: CoA transferase, partial [Dehalococcoidia bacterium]